MIIWGDSHKENLPMMGKNRRMYKYPHRCRTSQIVSGGASLQIMMSHNYPQVSGLFLSLGFSHVMLARRLSGKSNPKGNLLGLTLSVTKVQIDFYSPFQEYLENSCHFLVCVKNIRLTNLLHFIAYYTSRNETLFICWLYISLHAGLVNRHE